MAFQTEGKRTLFYISFLSRVFVGEQCSLILVPTSSFFTLTSSFIMFWRALFPELLSKYSKLTSSEPSVSLVETAASVTGQNASINSKAEQNAVDSHSQLFLTLKFHTGCLTSLILDSKSQIKSLPVRLLSCMNNPSSQSKNTFPTISTSWSKI